MSAVSKDRWPKICATIATCFGMATAASWHFGGQAYDDAKKAVTLAQDNARGAAASKFENKIAPMLETMIVVQRQRENRPQPMDDALLFSCLDDQMQNSIVVENNVGRSATAGHFPIDRPQLKECFVTSVVNNDLTVAARQNDKLGASILFMGGTAVSGSLLALSGLMTWFSVQTSTHRNSRNAGPANNI